MQGVVAQWAQCPHNRMHRPGVTPGLPSQLLYKGEGGGARGNPGYMCPAMWALTAMQLFRVSIPASPTVF
jgi:hypothetical protein